MSGIPLYSPDTWSQLRWVVCYQFVHLFPGTSDDGKTLSQSCFKRHGATHSFASPEMWKKSNKNGQLSFNNQNNMSAFMVIGDSISHTHTFQWLHPPRHKIWPVHLCLPLWWQCCPRRNRRLLLSGRAPLSVKVLPLCWGGRKQKKRGEYTVWDTWKNKKQTFQLQTDWKNVNYFPAAGWFYCLTDNSKDCSNVLKDLKVVLLHFRKDLTTLL